MLSEVAVVARFPMSTLFTLLLKTFFILFREHRRRQRDISYLLERIGDYDLWRFITKLSQLI